MSEQPESHQGATASFSGFNFTLPPAIRGFYGAVVIVTSAYFYAIASKELSLAQAFLCAAAYAFAVGNMAFVRYLELMKSREVR